MSKLKVLAKNPWRIFTGLAGRGLLNWMPDEPYLKLVYRARMKKKLNLKDPKTFNEKLQWLKLYDRKPLYTVLVDKAAVRDYIADTIGGEYLIPLLGVWENPEDIDFDALPDRFVLKCNHNSGLGMCICKDKAALDTEKVRAQLRQGLEQDYYLTAREWPYKDVPRRIICEEFLSDGGKELADFKIHCFNGEPKFILVCRDRFASSGLTEDFFTPEWEHMPVRRLAHPNAAQPIERPAELERMLELARVLSKELPFGRIDFYAIKGKIYFGEITFFPASGSEPYEPEEFDLRCGQWLTLPKGK